MNYFWEVTKIIVHKKAFHRRLADRCMSCIGIKFEQVGGGIPSKQVLTGLEGSPCG